MSNIIFVKSFNIQNPDDVIEVMTIKELKKQLFYLFHDGCACILFVDIQK